jgi:hypothetical protein
MIFDQASVVEIGVDSLWLEIRVNDLLHLEVLRKDKK